MKAITVRVYAELKARDVSVFPDETPAKDRLSFFMGHEMHLSHIEGRFSGDSAQGKIRNRQDDRCLAFWDAKRISTFDEKSEVQKTSPATPDNAGSDETSVSIESRLQRLNDMLEKGLITPSEAKVQRTKILEEL